MVAKGWVEAQVAGYEWALRNPDPLEDYDIDLAIVQWWGDNDVPQEIEAAFYQGVRHSSRPSGEDMMSVQAAAELKGVAPNTIYRILQDEEKRRKHFPMAMSNGEDATGRKWLLFAGDVNMWEPDARGRKRS